MFFWGDYTYTSVAELKRKSEKTLKRLKTATPVLPHSNSRKICNTWWGEAWCKNLENYADYESRLGRGRSYFRAGTVVDLKIKDNAVRGKVQGSESAPYQIKINFDRPEEKEIEAITKKLSRRIGSVDALLKGDFPEDLKELFTHTKPGLFPAPEEIHFECTCFDWADMCKHIAAAMYAIGVKIDEEPANLFALRGIDIDKFLKGYIKDKVSNMLKNVDIKSDRIIKNADIANIFGIS